MDSPQTLARPILAQGDDVSIIMPAWNAAPFLAQAVASIQAQTHRNWRLYLINDASDDDTANIAQTLAEADARIHVITLAARSGAAIARNTGIRVATGRFIAFLDADDVWAPEKLSRQLAFMHETGASFSFTGYWRGGKDGRWRYVPARPTISHTDLMRANMIGCLTAIYDQNVLGKVEMPLLRQRQDYGLWLHLLQSTPHAHGLNEGLAGYRRGNADALSGTILSAQKANWRFFRQYQRLGRLRSTRCLCTHMLHKAVWLLRAKPQLNPRPWLP